MIKSPRIRALRFVNYLGVNEELQAVLQQQKALNVKYNFLLFCKNV